MKVEIGLTQHHATDWDAEKNEFTHKDEVLGARVLTVTPPDGKPIMEVLADITAESRGIMFYHTNQPPAWVACDDEPAIAAILAAHYGCAAGRPADVEETHWTEAGPPGVGPVREEA